MRRDHRMERLYETADSDSVFPKEKDQKDLRSLSQNREINRKKRKKTSYDMCPPKKATAPPAERKRTPDNSQKKMRINGNRRLNYRKRRVILHTNDCHA